MQFEYLVVGSGLTGAVVARELVDAGRRVLVVDRRAHAGGNVHDHVHASGIRVHTYGPHYFRTNDDGLWAFVNRFASFHRYEPALKSLVDGRLENWPIAGSYIRRVVGESWQPEFTGRPGNFEEASLALMPRAIYEKFVKGYSEKQWGVPATELAPSLARRFDVREDDEPRLMRHRHQGIPSQGYAVMMQAMLAGIPVLLNVDYLRHRDELRPSRKIVFTGPIDEFFGFERGRLAYRGQRREHEYRPDATFVQPCGQVNNPDPTAGAHIRTLEWKHMMPTETASRIRGTVLTREFTYSPDEPDSYEYPFPDDRNARLYEEYRSMAASMPGVLICGRLGEYRYYDMDQAIARARLLAARLMEERAAAPRRAQRWPRPGKRDRALSSVVES
ncbi:UDP-galactopyranose mutase [Opitutales bacterium ASA1]|uniref:UDP-galactopyranose mutase n=1 Tax=Congregicoccus parvus TaxID=3081749 RepID=UPI002B2D886C|nr:UDP-galactopyranose mutase [Opitutales bacterium ASA1]